ncbi:hypothetical protein KQX54_008653 [Cotesia glomerata]|uniref:Uncharacterized protein n=1 Tax=Cotesia glomerata TaxID=32391 RepID=A0AAV7HTS7_COTGL|nr:hypothetical protein KQX54_008653 [Cotesia glomerata]
MNNLNNFDFVDELVEQFLEGFNMPDFDLDFGIINVNINSNQLHGFEDLPINQEDIQIEGGVPNLVNVVQDEVPENTVQNGDNIVQNDHNIVQNGDYIVQDIEEIQREEPEERVLIPLRDENNYLKELRIENKF